MSAEVLATGRSRPGVVLDRAPLHDPDISHMATSSHGCDILPPLVNTCQSHYLLKLASEWGAIGTPRRKGT